MDLHELHARFYPRVLAMARHLLKDADEAQEVAQEVFIAAWRRLPQYDAARGTEWSWLRSMTQTRCVDRVRAAERRGRLAQRSFAEPQANTADDSAVETLLAALPGPQRIAITMSVLLGYTHQEIAAQLGQPLGTVKTRIRLALLRLCALLQAEEPVLSAVRVASKLPA